MSIKLKKATFIGSTPLASRLMTHAWPPSAGKIGLFSGLFALRASPKAPVLKRLPVKGYTFVHKLAERGQILRCDERFKKTAYQLITRQTENLQGIADETNGAIVVHHNQRSGREAIIALTAGCTFEN